MVSYIKKDGEIMSQTTLDKKEVIIERGGVEITLFDDFISFRKDNVGIDLQIKER